MDPFVIEMDKAFRQLALDIIPSDEHLTNANICADKIFKLLQNKCKNDIQIGRVVIAGSTGKKTTIINSDIDCVLFINNKEPPFEKVLDDFNSILSTTDSYQIRDVHQTKSSVQFKALTYDFDILPATNFVVNHVGGGDEMIDIQQQHVLARIELNPKRNGYMYSSSLADASVRFMKQQTAFTHEMVRIVKFWYKTLHFIERISGAKSFVELIAVYAARKEEKMGNSGVNSYLRCFKQFIEYLKDFEHLNIHFEMNDSKFLDKARPRVIDPVNPYNNLAKNWEKYPESIAQMKRYANETDRRLGCLANARLARLNELFEPHLWFLPIINEVFPENPDRSQWLVGSVSISSTFPDLKVRNERIRKDFKLWKSVEFFKSAFQFVVFATLASPNCNSNEVAQVKEAIQNTISRQVFKRDVTWVSGENDEHEDYDLTFTIPIKNQKAIRLSYRL